MATIDAINTIDGTVYGKFTISADEALDVRKHALMAAVTVYQGKGDYLTNEYAILNLAKMFEEHLTRNVGNG